MLFPFQDLRGETFGALLCLMVAQIGRPDDDAAKAEVDREDSELLERSRQGDRGAYYDLFTKHLPLLRGICCKTMVAWRLDVGTEIEDILQHTCLQGLENIHAMSNPKAYLCRIARNRCIDRVREQKKTVIASSWTGETEEDPLSFVVDPEPTPGKRVFSWESTQRVREALEQLPEHERWAVVLPDLWGGSHEEAASQMRAMMVQGAIEKRDPCLAKNVKMWNFRGKKKLYELLKDEWD